MGSTGADFFIGQMPFQSPKDSLNILNDKLFTMILQECPKHQNTAVSYQVDNKVLLVSIFTPHTANCQLL